MIKAASLPIEVNLLRFSQFLQSQGIAHRINEESGQQVIWVEGAQEAAVVTEVLARWSFDQESAVENTAANRGVSFFNSRHVINSLIAAFVRAPISLSLIVACLLVALVSSLGVQPQRVSMLFYPLLDSAGLIPLLASIDSMGELLRSFAPMLLHFGELHLAFNMMWLWYFGRQLESSHPTWLFVVLILFCSFAANTTQYLTSGYNNFGGMSGVVYGLVGYAWIIRSFMPRSLLLINNTMFVVFIVALLAMEVVASSWIASAAHIGGLLAGLLQGVLVVFFYRIVLGRRAIVKR